MTTGPHLLLHDPDEAGLDVLRTIGDPDADQLAAGLLSRHADLDEGELVRLVLHEVTRRRRPGDRTDDAARDWLIEELTLPDWADPVLIQRGQDFFDDWPLPIATALFCVSLPSAYAAADGAQVLAFTSDLATHNLARRIAETGRMLFDVMDLGRGSPDALRPGGQGYVTVRGVRLLHSVVRQTLLCCQSPPWDVTWGLPINQEDLLGTLLTFTTAVFEGLDRLGIPYDPDAAEAYLHTWCVIGHLLGIRADLLPLDRAAGEALVGAIARRHHRPSPAGQRLMSVLLAEMEMSMPWGLRKLPRTLIRRQLPTDVADMLEVPPPAWWHPTVGLLAGVGPALRRIPGGASLLQVPSGLVGKSLLRRLVDRELHGGQPGFRLDAAAVQRLSIDTSALRTSLRRRRHQRRSSALGHPLPGGHDTMNEQTP